MHIYTYGRLWICLSFPFLFASLCFCMDILLTVLLYNVLHKLGTELFLSTPHHSFVEDFKYLGSIISRDKKDIKTRLEKALQCFRQISDHLEVKFQTI